MCRKWKKTAALGLAVLIGGMMPMSTMLAAEDNTEVAQEIETDSVSDADAVPGDETISDDNESIVDEVNAEEENTDGAVNADDENAGDEVIADAENAADEADTDDGNAGGDVNVDDVIADDEVDPINEQNVGIKIMSASDVAEAGNIEVLESTDASVIDITFNGQSSCYALGGTIDYIYVNNRDQAFEVLPGQDVKYWYCLDLAEKVTDPAKNEEQLASLWSKEPERQSFTMQLGDDQNYVMYVKAEKDGQITYARSGGVVVDTIDPEIIGVEDGKTYSKDKKFQVKDVNLSEVQVNGEKVEPEEDGKYKVAAKENSTSCVITAIDKAGRRTTCSINVSGGDQEEDPTEDTVISESKVYALKAGVKYHLAAGNWKVDGDKSVYQGDSDFYVKEDGDYKFSK